MHMYVIKAVPQHSTDYDIVINKNSNIFQFELQ